MARKTTRSTLGLLLLAVAIAAVVTFVAARSSRASDPCGSGGYTSAGCVLYNDYRPVYGGCVGSFGSNCYDCQYTCTYGYSNCGETIDGSGQYCIFKPFQQFP